MQTVQSNEYKNMAKYYVTVNEDAIRTLIINAIIKRYTGQIDIANNTGEWNKVGYDPSQGRYRATIVGYSTATRNGDNVDIDVTYNFQIATLTAPS